MVIDIYAELPDLSAQTDHNLHPAVKKGREPTLGIWFFLTNPQNLITNPFRDDLSSGFASEFFRGPECGRE